MGRLLSNPQASSGEAGDRGGPGGAAPATLMIPDAHDADGGYDAQYDDDHCSIDKLFD